MERLPRARTNRRTGWLLVLIMAITLPAFSGWSKSGTALLPSPSVSVGLPIDGSLQNGEVIPKTGSGYVLLSATTERRNRFGVLELVMMVKEASHRVHSRHKGSKLRVGDLSSRKGGPLEHHASHQSGRDVDLTFYMLDRNGKSVSLDTYVPFDKNGFSVSPSMEYRFDTTRNWSLLEHLLRSRWATVQWIFIADHLKELLLAHGEKTGASREIIRRARQILRQPDNSAHWDHFHVRIYCPSNDTPECRDMGPRWAWAR